MATDVMWQREGDWPTPRTFDSDAALAAMSAVTTANTVQIQDYDPESKSITKSNATHYTPAPSWRTLVTQPDLARDEAWFYYTILWKKPESTIAEAAAEPFPADPLGRVRNDLAERVTPPWFDDIAYWCSVAGMLSREDLARFVGSARIFVHKYKEGGASIITSYSARVSFIEAFYQTIVHHLGDAEWDVIAAELGTIDHATISEKSVSLATESLRLAAASGRFDSETLAVLETRVDVGIFDVLHAMRDATHLATHAPRHQLLLHRPLMLEKWIDRFGDAQSDWIVQSINAAKTKKDAAPLVATIARLLPDAALAPLMAQIRESKAKPDVEKWLARREKAGKSSKPRESTKQR